MTFFRNNPYVVSGMAIVAMILCVVIAPMVFSNTSSSDAGGKYMADENLLVKYGHPGLPAVMPSQILVDETLNLDKPGVVSVGYLFSDDNVEAEIRFGMTPDMYDAFLREVSVPLGTDPNRLVLSEKTVTGLTDLHFIYATMLDKTAGKNPIGINYKVHVIQ